MRFLIKNELGKQKYSAEDNFSRMHEAVKRDCDGSIVSSLNTNVMSYRFAVKL